MKLKAALLCGLALAAVGQAQACYTVYGPANRVLYQGEQAPVDMRLPLQEALAQRWPGVRAEMVFNQADVCPRSPLLQAAASPARAPLRAAATPARPSPLFTDAQTAQRMNLPHTQVAGDVVVVPARAAERVDFATFSVIDSETAPAVLARDDGAPDTRVLGGPPARSRATARAAAVPPRPLAPGDTIITEMRDPPVTIVQRGDSITIRNPR